MKELSKTGFKYMLATRCFTYNHAYCIEQALNGFIIQQTEFPFVVVVVDDASPDGEKVIIQQWILNLRHKGSKVESEKKDYGLLTTVQPSNNKNCYMVFLLLNENHTQTGRGDKKLDYISEWMGASKYHAWCEGDDYWIDPTKLQKQVAFLENNPDYSMCYHNAIKLYMQGNRVSLFNACKDVYDLSMEDAINKWSVPSASIVYRSSYSDYPSWLAHIYSSDYALILRCRHGGKVRCMPDIMSVYRINEVGDSASARMKGKMLFICEQHVKLLDSFNQGTGLLYDDIISKRVSYLKTEIDYLKSIERGWLFCLFNKAFYKKMLEKARSFLKYR